MAPSLPDQTATGFVRFYCWHCFTEHQREGHEEPGGDFRMHGVNQDLCDQCRCLMVITSDSVEPLGSDDNQTKEA